MVNHCFHSQDTGRGADFSLDNILRVGPALCLSLTESTACVCASMHYSAAAASMRPAGRRKFLRKKPDNNLRKMS